MVGSTGDAELDKMLENELRAYYDGCLTRYTANDALKEYIKRMPSNKHSGEKYCK